MARIAVSGPGATFDRVHREIRRNEDYFAILYEFVPDSDESDTRIGSKQAQLSLLWEAGFCVLTHRDNWKSGLLLDMADLIGPFEPGWPLGCYHRLAEQIRAST